MKLRRSKRERARTIAWLRQRTVYSDREADQTVNVYDAERYGEATSNAVLKRQDVPSLICAIMRSRYWKKHHGKRPFRVRISGGHHASAYGSIDGITLPDSRFGRSVHTIVHEMAHACGFSAHGRKFIFGMLTLMREFEGKYYADRLRKRLKETGALR